MLSHHNHPKMAPTPRKPYAPYVKLVALSPEAARMAPNSRRTTGCKSTSKGFGGLKLAFGATCLCCVRCRSFRQFAFALAHPTPSLGAIQTTSTLHIVRCGRALGHVARAAQGLGISHGSLSPGNMFFLT